MSDAIVPRVLAGVEPTPRHTDSPPTLAQLIAENRALFFRVALLQPEPVRALVRHLLEQNRQLRAMLQARTMQMTAQPWAKQEESSGD